jgi:prepilin peptidase CpaA
MEWLKYAVAAVFIIAAVITDYREYKIKNRGVIVFSALGLVINGAAAGWGGLLDSVCGLLSPLVLIPLFALGMLGAGDIKALCAVGSIVGLKMGICTSLLSFVAGGIIALGFMIFRRNAARRFRQFGIYLKNCFYAMRFLPYGQLTDEKSGFRFSLGIIGGFAGAVVWMCV